MNFRHEHQICTNTNLASKSPLPTQYHHSVILSMFLLCHCVFCNTDELQEFPSYQHSTSCGIVFLQQLKILWQGHQLNQILFHYFIMCVPYYRRFLSLATRTLISAVYHVLFSLISFKAY